MNIGIVTTWFERGAAYVSRAYMDALSARHSVFIFARGGERYATGDPCWDLPNVTWGSRAYYLQIMDIDWNEFRNWIVENNIKAVIFNEQNNWNIIIKIIQSDLNIAIGSYVDYYTPQTAPFFGLYDFLLCNTKRHLSVFKNHSSALYIPWGTDIDLFCPHSTDNAPADRNGIVFFNSTGLRSIRKGTDLVIKAFSRVKGNARLIIHSQVPDLFLNIRLDTEYLDDPDGLANEIQQIVVNDKRIEIIEKEIGAPGLFHLGDVYVYPSRLEGIGLTIAEALACGLPVITTDSGPMNEFINPGVNGRVVPVALNRSRIDNYYWPISVCSEDALVEAMQFYIDNFDKIIEFKKQARNYALEYLDWKKNSKELNSTIERWADYKRKPFNKLKLLATVKEYEKRTLKVLTFGTRLKIIASRMRFFTVFHRAANAFKMKYFNESTSKRRN